MDTVVLIDSSGSMKQTDPDQLRKPAAKLFISLLDKTDKVSVVSFSGQAWPITYLTQLDSEEHIKQALQATDKVSHKGVHTNIHAALSKGLEFLSESKRLNRDPVLVLMTDGQIDVGDEKESIQLRQHITSNLLPQLIDKGIKVFSIAFTENSDQSLLEDISEATGGQYSLASSDAVLHKVFSKIFEQTKNPEMLPLSENRFVVDPSIQEITVIANKSSKQSKVYLQQPDGKKLTSDHKTKNINWFISTRFDMITISKPAIGEWKILFSEGDNLAYIATDIKLHARYALATEIPQPDLMIKSWFEQGGQPENNKDLINNIKLSIDITRPDKFTDSATINHPNKAGTFIAQYKPVFNGLYKVKIAAKSKTFQRQKTFTFKNSILEKREPDPAPASTPVQTKEPETKPEKVNAVEQDSKEESNIIQVIIIFGLVNIVIIAILIGGYFIYQRSRKRKLEAKDDTSIEDS